MSKGLREFQWERFPDDDPHSLLEQLYEPAMSVSISYDRVSGYFGSSVLAACARGFGTFIQRMFDDPNQFPKPSIRIVTSVELDEEDVRALLETGEQEQLTAELLRSLKSLKDVVAKRRLECLAWLYKNKHLDLRVAVKRRGAGLAHAKFGLFADPSGDSIFFHGSNNETEMGVLENYEQVELGVAWEDAKGYNHWRSQFDTLWKDEHKRVRTVDLPTAVKEKLLKFAPKQAPAELPEQRDLERLKAATRLAFLRVAPLLDNGDSCDATAPLKETWPHQRKVIRECYASWPDGRLLCDEVGMGKTVEGALILRRVLLRGVDRRALLLVPAGLRSQWQGELREKAGLWVPYFEPNSLIWPDGTVGRDCSFEEALKQPILIVSRELARRDDYSPTLLCSEPWDIVLLDEAHHARRSGQSQDSANKLMALARNLRTKGAAKGLLFLSATPMQINPWEPWDLCSVLGEGGPFNSTFGPTERLFHGIAQLERGSAEEDDLDAVERFLELRGDGHTPPTRLSMVTKDFARNIAQLLPRDQQTVADWIRSFAPLNLRMHRNTRQTLREYYQRGLLKNPPPERDPHDHLITFPEDGEERKLYHAVDQYIEKRYRILEDRGAGKGFVMTVYRRRATSSPFALAESLRRRQELLEYRKGIWRDVLPDEFLDADEREELEELGLSEDELALSDAREQEIKDELREIKPLREQIERLLGSESDSKFAKFRMILQDCRSDGRPVLVFTGYTDTMIYLRDNLRPLYGAQIACYSGSGGSIWDEHEAKWVPVDKSVVTKMLFSNKLSVLVCTDAASEGLNLQAAGALINYDLPWNPSKVEQRIGRIDRIGQKYSKLPIHNLFMAGSVEADVYQVLRNRCKLFEKFVGEMQPVLAIARKKLLAAMPSDGTRIKQELEQEAEQRKNDPVAKVTYQHDSAEPETRALPAANKKTLEQALADLQQLGVGVRSAKNSNGVWTYGKRKLAISQAALESTPAAIPFSSGSPIVAELMRKTSAQTTLPVVVVRRENEGTSSAAVAWCSGGSRPVPVESFDQLHELLEKWDGRMPTAAERASAERLAAKQAKRLLEERHQTEFGVEESVREGLIDAAKERLRVEVALTLACIAQPGERFDQAWYRRMSGRTTDGTLNKAHGLIGYLGLSAADESRYRETVEGWSKAKRDARNTLSDIRNALEDWRWGVSETGRFADG